MADRSSLGKVSNLTPCPMKKERNNHMAKRWKIYSGIFMCVFFCFCSQELYASEVESNAEIQADYIRKETVVTDSEDIDLDVYNTIEIDGIKYHLIAHEDNVKKDEAVLSNTVIKDNLPNQDWEPDQNYIMTYNGQSINLKLDHVNYEKEDVRTESIEVIRQFDEGEIPESITENYSDPITGKRIQAILTLQSQQTLSNEWKPGLSIPITVYDYDADYYVFSGYNFYLDSNGELDISGKESAILNYLGMSDENYRITDIHWSGDSYMADGQLCRQALATGDYLAHSITAIYTGILEYPQTYKGVATYTGSIEKATYTHDLTLQYEIVPKNNEIGLPIIVITVAQIVLLILLILILYRISRKRKGDNYAKQ